MDRNSAGCMFLKNTFPRISGVKAKKVLNNKHQHNALHTQHYISLEC